MNRRSLAGLGRACRPDTTVGSPELLQATQEDRVERLLIAAVGLRLERYGVGRIPTRHAADCQTRSRSTATTMYALDRRPPEVGEHSRQLVGVRTERLRRMLGDKSVVDEVKQLLAELALEALADDLSPIRRPVSAHVPGSLPPQRADIVVEVPNSS